MTTRICSRKGARWQLPGYKQHWQQICALMPAYLEDGTNGTVVHYLDNTADKVAYRLQWVLEDLLGHLCTSRAVLTKESRAYMGHAARRVPLLAPQFTLVPVKGREAIGQSDSVSGYVVLEHVADVIPYGSANRIYFEDGSYVTVLDSTRTVWENLNLAKELKQYRKEESICPSIPLQSAGA